MSSREVENICKYLKSKDIQISPNNRWLSSCISWYKSHPELSNVYGSLEDYVCVQWLLSDLQDVNNACLPTNYKDRVINLSGKYAVQVNCARDIGKSCYSQLQAIQHLDESESYFSEDEPKKQNWEPKAKRVLMMEITDGVTNLKAMEYSPIPKLLEPFIPGTKVVLTGPIECRNGILLLKNDNVKPLGGEVERLYKNNSLETVLSRCLNIVKENDTENAEVNNTVPRRLTNNVTQSTRPTNNVINPPRPENNVTNPTRPENNVTNPTRPSNNVTNPVWPTNRATYQTTPPYPAITTNDDVSAIDSSNVMLDEDDEFFCGLPDEVLDCPEDRERSPSPVLDNHMFETSRQVTPQTHKVGLQSPTVHSSVDSNRLQRMNKPKLFPSLEDLRSVGRESSSSNVLIADSSRLSTGITKIGASSTYLNKSFGSSLSANQLMTNNSAMGQNFTPPTIDSSNVQEDIKEMSFQLNEDSADCFSIGENKYPQVKKVQIKMENIIKLKIRNGEWFCCASVSLENQQLNVTFSNEVLETLFGIAASEVEVWRGEMSTNPSLKKKVNDILKAGQTKLKLLRCPMTLEYSSEDCTPQVIEINMQ